MEKFVNINISDEEFSDNFPERVIRLNYECVGFQQTLDSENLIDFQPDPRSDGFSQWINFLKTECDNFSEDYQNEEFYNSVKDTFLGLQKVLNEK